MCHVIFIFFRHNQSDAQYKKHLDEGIQDDRLMAQLQALGLFGKLVSGPWMTLMYKNESQKKNLDMVSSTYLPSAVFFFLVMYLFFVIVRFLSGQFSRDMVASLGVIVSLI